MGFLVSVRCERLQTVDPANAPTAGDVFTDSINRPALARAAGLVTAAAPLQSRAPVILVPKGAADRIPGWRKTNKAPIEEREVLTYQAPWTKHKEHADVVIVGADPTDPTS